MSMATETASRLDPLAIACGDPAGVGPYVSALAALDVARRGERVRLFGDRVQLDGLLGGATERALIEVDDVGRVDPACVRGLAEDPVGGTMVASIVSMGAALGLEVVAEGVETPDELCALRARGCTAFQGYLFGRPSPAGDYEASLARA